MTGRIELKRCAIVMDAEEPPYVSKIANDLKHYLAVVHKADVCLAPALSKSAKVVIAVGRRAVEEITGQFLSLDDLGAEGFVIRRLESRGRRIIAVAGNQPQGTKFGLGRLMQMVSAADRPASGGKSAGKAVFVDLPSDIKSIPRFARRGIHLNGWSFNYPYAFRPWREADWKKFIDLQTLQGVNLFYLWPFMEIMPAPLSVEDKAYLEEVRRVVEYARVQNGMEVWIMQAVNRVAADNCGVQDPRYRPYWRPSQVDLDPGNPEQFRKIAASHEAFYRVLNNADGFCFIDSDPGGMRKSSPNDLLKVFLHARACLNRHSRKGKQTKIIHWLHMGWPLCYSRPFNVRDRVIRRVLRVMKTSLPEPWEIICGWTDYLSSCRAEGVLGKTTYLPYNTVEGEPSYPRTNFKFGNIRRDFNKAAAYPGLKGIMANAQTAFLQFPHLFYWHKLAWDPRYKKTDTEDVLRELAEQLYPGHEELLAACFKAFGSPPPANVDALAGRLKPLLKKNKVGCFGTKLFPDGNIVIRALALQLKLVSASRNFFGLSRKSFDRNKFRDTVQTFFDAYLGWDLAHGWHGLWGYGNWPLGGFSLQPPFNKQFASVLKYIHRQIGLGPALEQIFQEITDKLGARYGSVIVIHGCIEPLRQALKNSRGKKTQ